ncbi:hypothetical protein ACO3_430019 [Thiomonas arsenitoxydans]|nr:hypothetical protein ACO3_430019 [Thiomonas arsenitoxydans]
MIAFLMLRIFRTSRRIVGARVFVASFVSKNFGRFYSVASLYHSKF